MKKKCPSLNNYVDIDQCDYCDTICISKLDSERMILNIFFTLFPGYTFIDIEQAYDLIMNKIKSHIIDRRAL